MNIFFQLKQVGVLELWVSYNLQAGALCALLVGVF